MKYLLFLLLAVSSFAQSNDTFVVSGKNDNVVYRGLDNPVKIGVEGVDSNKITVSGEGVTKAEGAGNYIIRPRSGKELLVTITYKNKKGKTVTEERKYKILPFPQIVYTVNGEYKAGSTYQLTKDQMLKLKLGTTFNPECNLFEKATVKSFSIKVPGYSTVTCKGNTLNMRALKIIEKLSYNGEIIIIDNVVMSRVAGFSGTRCKISPIVIKLVH